MTRLGLPPVMWAVFGLVIAAGWVGAVHFLVVHVLMRRRVSEELPPRLLRPRHRA